MKTRIPRDNIHMSWRPIDGYNKQINVFISPREPGKTDTTWWEKIYSQWVVSGKPWGYLVRNNVEITDAMLQDIEDTINKWTIDPVEFQFKKGEFKEGIVDIKIKGKLFFRCVSLSLPLRRIKQAKIRNIGGIFMDEFIIDPKSGEKYNQNEYFKIKELYTTYRRSYEGDGILKMYFCGNPYSLFNPLFVGLGVDVVKLRKDKYEMVNGEWRLYPNIMVKDNYAIEWGVLHPVLKEQLLEKNPFYQFDEEYSDYALEGIAVNDRNIKTGKLPKNFYLSFVLKIAGKFVGIFQNNYINDLEDRFFCKFVDEVSAKRTIYCFEFDEMVERSILMSIDERMKLQRFKDAMRKRMVSFEDINVYYYMEEAYKNL
ncbi:MAG: phage DNA encapsidation protein [Methanobrevibacter sp.]|nr:phage DNA encapsidation protein [Methanobrevibacter sp.]